MEETIVFFMFNDDSNNYFQKVAQLASHFENDYEMKQNIHNIIGTNSIIFGANASGKSTFLRSILLWFPIDYVNERKINVSYVPISRIGSLSSSFGPKQIVIENSIDTLNYFRDFMEIEDPNSGTNVTAIENSLLRFSEEISDVISRIFNCENRITVQNYKQLSDGYLSILSIICNILYFSVDFHQTDNANFYELAKMICGVSLIDELDSYIHQTIQIKITVELSDLFPNVVFVATTHSPSIIKGAANFNLYNISTDFVLTEVNDYQGQTYDFILENLFSNTDNFKLFTEFVEIRNHILSSETLVGFSNYKSKLDEFEKEFNQNTTLYNELLVLKKILELENV